MSWAEEQQWFGMEDVALCDTPQEEILKGNWVQADGTFVLLTNMSDNHLDNAIRMIEDGRLNREWALPYLKGEKKRRERQKMIDDFFDNLLKKEEHRDAEEPPITNSVMHRTSKK